MIELSSISGHDRPVFASYVAAYRESMLGDRMEVTRRFTEKYLAILGGSSHLVSGL